MSQTTTNDNEIIPSSLLSHRILSAIDSPHLQRVSSFVKNDYTKTKIESKLSMTSSSIVYDFTFGNPHDMAIPSFLSAYHKYVDPLNTSWYAYCNSGNSNADPSRKCIAESLSKRMSPMTFDYGDVYLVKGNIGGLYTCLSLLLNKDDEVIFPIPSWFLYEAMIIGCQGTSVEVKLNEITNDLDIDNIKQKINDKTKAIIINSPHNPTGKIYSLSTLKSLSDMLLDEYKNRKEKYGRNAHPIWLISDEAYNRIILDNNEFISPSQVYPYTFICYTYAKTLLNPGIRLGYVALSNQVPSEYRSLFRTFFPSTLAVNGFTIPDCVPQYMIQDLETLSISIDIQHMEKKINMMLDLLSTIGYTVRSKPQGTFYIMVTSPLTDDQAFCRLLGKHNILCLPGSVCCAPGYFRLCLTATEDMIENSRDGFQQAYQEAMNLLSQNTDH